MKPHLRLQILRHTQTHTLSHRSTSLFPYLHCNIAHAHYATNNDRDDDHHHQASSLRLSVQYPPPPFEERYSKPIKPSGYQVEPFKDVQFKAKEPQSSGSVTTQGFIPKNEQNAHTVDKEAASPSTPEEELYLGGVTIDPLQLKKMIPHGTASKAEIEQAMAEENMEWKGVHWSERNYTAKLGDIVQRQRPDEVKRMMECTKPNVHRDGLRSCQPVEAGGPAYPVFYDPKSGDGLDRPQSRIPRDIDGRKARVTHIASLRQVTGISHSECALQYDMANGQYSIALERLRRTQVDKLVQRTHKNRDECKKVFDQCLGNFDKALRKLQR